MEALEALCPLQAVFEDAAADEATRTFVATKLAVDVAVCAVILAGNALTICALLHQRWSQKDKLCPRFRVSSLFVMNLAVADFMIGLSLLLLIVVHNTCSVAEFLTRHRFLCLFKTATLMFSAYISLSTLAAVSLDRYVAVVHSLRYQEYMTRRRAAAVIAVTWLVGLLGAASLFLWNHFEYGQPCVDNVVPRRHFALICVPLHTSVLSVIAAVHLRIRREIQLLRARRREHSRSAWGPRAPSRRSRRSRSDRAVVLVIGCYAVCYMPFLAVFGARLMGARSLGLDVAFQCLCTLANLNPMLNPFIYSWKHASVRSALRQLFESVKATARGGKAFTPSTTVSSLSAAAAVPAVISGRIVADAAPAGGGV